MNESIETSEADARPYVAPALDVAPSEMLASAPGARGHMPQDVRDALDRMCTPLHDTRLCGVTAKADAQCMDIIRRYCEGIKSPSEDLHTFLNAAAADGLVFDGIDAADLYIAIFHERYAAVCADQVVTRPWPMEEQPDGTINAVDPADMAAGLPAKKMAELERLRALVNNPQTAEFLAGVQAEAAHQVIRWGEARDRSKSAENWFWLVGYLAGKCLRACITGDKEKALHHTISAGAALAQWHAAIKSDTSGTGVGTDADLSAMSEGAARHG